MMRDFEISDVGHKHLKHLPDYSNTNRLNWAIAGIRCVVLYIQQNLAARIMNAHHPTGSFRRLNTP